MDQPPVQRLPANFVTQVQSMVKDIVRRQAASDYTEQITASLPFGDAIHNVVFTRTDYGASQTSVLRVRDESSESLEQLVFRYRTPWDPMGQRYVIGDLELATLDFQRALWHPRIPSIVQFAQLARNNPVLYYRASPFQAYTSRNMHFAHLIADPHMSTERSYYHFLAVVHVPTTDEMPKELWIEYGSDGDGVNPRTRERERIHIDISPASVGLGSREVRKQILHRNLAPTTLIVFLPSPPQDPWLRVSLVSEYFEDAYDHKRDAPRIGNTLLSMYNTVAQVLNSERVMFFRQPNVRYLNVLSQGVTQLKFSPPGSPGAMMTRTVARKRLYLFLDNMLIVLRASRNRNAQQRKLDEFMGLSDEQITVMEDGGHLTESDADALRARAYVSVDAKVY